MSIERLTRRDGRVVYVVRWYDSGRGSAKRKRTFDRRKDAEFFEASLRRARQLGQLSSEVIGSGATLEEFLVEWWDTYAVTHLRPGTLATYTYLLDKWIVPYLGRKRLRDITRETIDNYAAALRADGAGVPTINRTLGVLQGVFHRAVEWRRLAVEPRPRRPPAHARPRRGDRRPHARDRRGDPRAARATRRRARQRARLRGPPARRGVRAPVARRRRRPRPRPASASSSSAPSPASSSRPPSRSAPASPSCSRPVAKELVELYLAAGRPDPFALVFPDSEGGHLPPPELAPPRLDPGARARRRRLLPHLRPPPHLRDAAALRGPHLNEVADHLGHADPGFTARTYAHVMRDAPKRRRVSIARAIADCP